MSRRRDRAAHQPHQPHHRMPGVAGLRVCGPDGRLGRARGIVPGPGPGSPSWLVVGTGLLGLREVLVPLPHLSVATDGVHVPFGREQVRQAPRPDAGGLTPSTEAALLAHYGTRGAARPAPGPATAAPGSQGDVAAAA